MGLKVRHQIQMNTTNQPNKGRLLFQSNAGTSGGGTYA